MAQQQLLSEEAFELVEGLGETTVSSSQLSSIGYQLAQGMEFKKAEQLYMAVIARDSSRNTTARRVALGGLAELYMAPAAQRFNRFDPDKGRAKWESLLDDIGGSIDGMSLVLRAETLGRWAAAELNAGLADDARKPSAAATEKGRRLLAQAKDVLNDLMANDPVRGSLLMIMQALEVDLANTEVDSFSYDTVVPGVFESASWTTRPDVRSAR